ncbi:MAG: hypothetical protein ABIZ04_24875 [Opitutus sp.]
MKRSRLWSILVAAGAVAILLGVAWWGGARYLRPGARTAATVDRGLARDRSVTRIDRPLSDRTGDPQNAAKVRRIQELLATLEPVLPGETENRAALELLRWWAEIDPAAAIAYAHGHPAIHGRLELPTELFTVWLEAREEAALAWATTLPRGELRAQLLPAVIAVMAETRPRDALIMASELQGENRRIALASLFAEWSSSDPSTAAEQAQHLPTSEEQNLALRQVIGKWADLDLQASVAWVKRLPPPGDPGSVDISVSPLEILLEKWTAQSPMDATHFLAALPDGTRRIQMLSTAAGQWAQQNPRDALAWAAGLASETDRNVALRGVLNGVAQSDHAAAANLALTLPAGAEQQKGIELIIDQWSARAPDSLMRWATAQLSDSSRQRALPAIVTAWAGADLPTLGDWLGALPPGPARDSACVALARYLAPTQPELARQWAASIADSRLRERQVNEIASINGRRPGF